MKMPAPVLCRVATCPETGLGVLSAQQEGRHGLEHMEKRAGMSWMRWELKVIHGQWLLVWFGSTQPEVREECREGGGHPEAILKVMQRGGRDRSRTLEQES